MGESSKVSVYHLCPYHGYRYFLFQIEKRIAVRMIDNFCNFCLVWRVNMATILQEEEWKSKHRESLRKEKSQKQRVEEKKDQEESVANWPKVRPHN
jgi:hypothetical protein